MERRILALAFILASGCGPMGSGDDGQKDTGHARQWRAAPSGDRDLDGGRDAAGGDDVFSGWTTLPEEGDDVGNGKVVDTTQQGQDCFAVTVEHPPAWECNAEQIAEAQSYPQYPGGGYGTQPGDESDVRLRPTDCEGLADLRREALRSQYLYAIEQSRWAVLFDKCLAHTRTHYVDADGRPRDSCWGGYGGDAAFADAGCASDSGGGSGGAKEYSTTNTQVPDVDEADFIKNDGEFMYILSARGLQVIDAWPAPEAREIARVAVEGAPRRLFLYEDRLVVYSRLGNDAGGGPGVPSSQGCTYGYECRFSSEGGRTLAAVLDVADPARPVEIARYEMSGGYVSSRRIGPVVYTVVHDEGVSSVPGIDLFLSADNPFALEIQYRARAAAIGDAMDALDSANLLPWVRMLDQRGGVKAEIASCNDALAAKASAGMSFVSVASFDLRGPGRPHRSLVATKPGFVFASADALYLSTDGVDGSDYISYYGDAEHDRSTIHKFVLDGTAVRYRGSAAVRGHVLNQFSMDEHEGVLRVATTSGWVWNPGVASTVTTIREQSGDLRIVGELSGLAPGEDIRSVRFDGDRGYVVTFKKTDPLFVLDLSNPAAPRVLGELKIPGFSTYMHMLDPGHVLAIGFDADDHGGFAYFDGIQIQIFDVSVLSNPRLMHKTVVGTRGSGSEAIENHLAFNYFAPRKMLALPTTICEGGDDGMYGQTLTFSGLMVFDVSLDAGIDEHGRMPFVEPSENQHQTCGSWWTDARSLVKRSIFMDGFMFGLSDTALKIASLDDLSEVLRTIPIGTQP
jgi:hypothetical protein